MPAEIGAQPLRVHPGPLRVLLVEDNPDDAFLLDRFLRRNGFAVEMTRVETSGEMLRALGRSDDAEPVDLPEVVLADYHLPNFSGPDALQLLKATGLDIPFIMMSGAISEETAVESMRAGAQDYVTKQNLTRLVPVLERELREAAARRNKVAAEKALLASEDRFHRLVEAMPIGLLISDSTGRISYANGAVERLLGYREGSMLEEDVTLNLLCPGLTIPASDGPITSLPFETVCRTLAGADIEVLLGVALLNPGSTPEDRQVAAFIADLTLQKKSEEVLRRTEKLAVAGRLAASIAHEINNPLEAVTNCLYLVGSSALPDEARVFLNLAQSELNRVAQITVQTLRFYRGSTRPSATSVHDLMETVVTLLDSRLKRQEIEVSRRWRNVPAIMVQDGEIRQVLANLVGNAIDALPEGGRILLRITPAREWIRDRHGVRITVADTGTGMSRETLNRIFEAFFSTKGLTGTGLGLWVSREIIDKHEGVLHVRSREQKPGDPAHGTVFTLFLPLEAAQKAH